MFTDFFAYDAEIGLIVGAPKNEAYLVNLMNS